MVEIENVTFSYAGADAGLTAFSLTVRPGECILLCGESGCGKTTVTKLVNGLIPHYTEGCSLTGKVSAAGMQVAETPLYLLARRIGSVFQNPKSQFFNLDTDSELAFGLENQGMEPERMEGRLADTIRNLKLDRLVHRKIFSLSGGEKQLLAFASVYAMNPDIYVLDEPTANLDLEAIEMLREQITLLKRQGHTVLIAEHRLYFLADLIDRAVFIEAGQMKKCFTGEAFRKLAEQERISLGLRTIRQPEMYLPEVRKDETADGLSVRGLACGYQKEPPVFEGLHFSVRRGEVVAVTGKNGVGKTTLIRCLCGLVKERSGEILLNGKALKPKQRRKVSFCVMQDVNHQLFYDSVRNECEQAAAGETARIDEALAGFDLSEFAERHPMSLSGGQKQRLAVATALLSEKEVLIFDEPTSGLDYRHMKEVCRVVRALAEEGHIVLVVSHDREFMQEACDSVLELVH